MIADKGTGQELGEAMHDLELLERKNTGKALRAIRLERHESQDVIAERAGFSQASISNYEQGKRDATPHLTALARGLRTTATKIKERAGVAGS